MYTVYDNINEQLVGVYNDYESAQMGLLFMSDSVPDGGANLTIEYISEPQEWAIDNGLVLETVM